MTDYTNDSINYWLATYLLNGFHAECHQVVGTDLVKLDEDGGYQATIHLACGLTYGLGSERSWTVKHRSRLGWLEAVEGCARQALWSLEETDGLGEPKT